jgi:sugar phosphate isomerase/epimerase
MKREQIGVQLYTLREMAAKDFDATLGSVAKMGYAGVEFAGFHGHSAKDVRAMLDKYGLKAFAAHISIDQFDGDIDGVISDLQTVGATWGIVPYVSPEDRSPDFFTALGEKMNGYGSRFADAGLRLGYHNHDFEFSMTTDAGKTIFETLLEITDPSLVSFELDLFWAAVGGYEPDQVMRQHPDRISLVHLKDGSELQSGKDVPFGEGVMDWGAILSAAREIGIEYYITEQDNPNPDNPIGDVEKALHNAERRADQ